MSALVEKKRVNSRSKGKSFEQAIARDLRAWLGDGWTVTRAQTDRQGGQVAGVAGEFQIDGPWEFPFAIECKAHESFEYSQLWTSPIVGPLPKFWAQAVRQADKVGRRPMLLLKRNLGAVLVVLRPTDAGSLLVKPRVTLACFLGGERVAVGLWEDVCETGRIGDYAPRESK